METDRNSHLQFEYYSSVKQRKVEWLWYPYIPFGKLTILQGDPGEGKSTFILAIAALLTKLLPLKPIAAESHISLTKMLL